MAARKFKSLLITFILVQGSMAQFCGQLGSTPANAYPICGNVTLTQTSWPPCGGMHEIFVAGCTGKGNVYFDKNPSWYKFTCYQAGTFGFEVTPDIPTDDFDWQIFDITGHTPSSVFLASQVVKVAANWANTAGGTGATPTGPNQTQCHADDPDSRNSYAFWPTLQVGHNYLLLLSHAHGSGNYSIAFGNNGSTADITDPILPHIVSASTFCSGTPLTVKFNRKLRCTSFSGVGILPLNSDGSEFSISPALSNVIGALRSSCENSFETDSIKLILDNPLPPGNYDLVIKNGFDGNSVSDFCDRFVPVGEHVSFVIQAVPLPHMDSVVQPGCSPDEIKLYFKKPIKCATISADGSQFIFSGGTTPVVPVSANGNCGAGADGAGNTITVKLSTPIFGKGNFTIKLATGSDGNQLADECNLIIPNGESVNFVTKDTVNADFDYLIKLGCKQDTIDFAHDGNNEIDSWQWTFDGWKTSTLQNPRILYDTFGLKQVQLIVSNGGCTDTSAVVSIMLDNILKAGFETLDLVCPGQTVSFKDSSVGAHIVSRVWTFGNGNTSTIKSPPAQLYPIPTASTIITAQLSVKDNIGCTSITTKKITLADICYVFVPGAFTPNNDGLNDYLYPLNVFNSSGFHFIVYSRFGQIMFESQDPSTRWNGRFKGQVADPGAYVWTLQYVDNNSGRTISQKGTSILIR